MANTTNSPSGNVDEHVVKMTFDNKQFEKNAQQSLNTVEKLKSSMNFEATVKGLDKLEDGVAQSNKALDSLNDSVDKIKDRFSNLGIIGVTALQNITNSVINTGKQMIKSLTIDPVKSGFNEYELKMNSMRTIIASTGESVKTVNKYLNDLNKYSDETIYNFSDMTNNIGKFTNAGVDLDTAVNAIKGVSSEAALAGANANEASRAMYNFSQALSAGYVKLIDWKSIENANMATQDFKNNLLQTASVLGTVTKKGNMFVTTTKNLNGKVSDAFNAQKNFNDSLSHQWLTNDVLNTTLEAYSKDLIKTKAQLASMTDEERKQFLTEKKDYEQKLKRKGFNADQIKQMEQLGHKAMAAAKEINTFSKMMDTLKEAVQSSWAATSEYIFGTLDQAKKLWTNLEQVLEGVIMKHNNLRNEILSDWNQLGGRDEMIQGFKNLGSSIAAIFKPIHDAFLAVFKPFEEQGGLGKSLYNLTVKFKNFADSIKPSKQEAKDLQDIFGSIFLVFKRVGQIISALVRGFGSLVKAMRPILDIFLNFGSLVANVISYVDYFVRSLGTAIKIIYDQFIGIDNTINFIKKIFTTVTNTINNGLTYIGKLLNKTQDATINNGKTVATVGDVIVKVLRVITEALAYVYAYSLVVIRAIVIAVGAVGVAVYGGVVLPIVKWFARTGVIGKVLKWLNGQFTITAYAADRTGKSISNSSKSAVSNVNKDFDKLSLGDKIKVIAATALENITNTFNSIINFFKTFVSNVKQYGIKEAIIRALHTIYINAKSVIDSLITYLKSLNVPQPIKNFFTMITNGIATVKAGLVTFFNYLSDRIPILKTIQDGIKKIKDSIKAGSLFGTINKTNDKTKDSKKHMSALQKIGEALAKTFHKVADALRDFVESIDVSKLKSILIAAVLSTIILAIARLIWSIGGMADAITTSLIPSLAGLNTSLKTLVTNINNKFFPTQKTFVTKFREIAEAVAILAGSILMLSMIDSKKLWPAVGAVLALLGAFTAVTIITEKMSKSMDAKALSTFKMVTLNMIAMAASIVSVATSLLILTKINNLDNLAKKVLAFVVMYASFVAAVTVAQRFWGKGMSLRNTAGILFFALSLKKVAQSLSFISGIDFKQIRKGLGGFLICVGILAGLAIAFGQSKWHSGANAIGFAISLMLLVAPLKALSKINYGNIAKALKSCQGVIITLAIVAGALITLGTVSKKGRSATHAVAALIKSIGVTLLALTATVAILGNLKKNTLNKGVTAVSLLAIFVGAAAGLAALGSRNSKTVAGFSTLMGIALSVAMLAGSVIVLGLVDGTTLAKGTAVVNALLFFFGVCARLSAGAAGVKIGPIIGIMASIVTLGIEVALLGLLPLNNMIQGLVGTGLVMAALGGLLAIISKIGKISLTAKQAIPIILSGVILLASVTGALIVLAEVTNEVGTNNMITAIVGLDGTIATLGALCIICNKVGGVSAGAIKSALFIGLFIDVLVGIVTYGAWAIAQGIGALQSFKWAQDNMDNFVKWMGQLGESFGKLIANFKKHIDEEKLNYLTNVQDAMYKYIYKLKDIDPKVVNAASASITAVKGLVDSLGIGGFSFHSIDTDGMSDFFTKLGEGVAAFKTSLSDAGGITNGDIKQFTSVVDAFSQIVSAAKKIPNSTQLYSDGSTDLATFFAGNNDLSYFLQQIAGTDGKPGFAETIVSTVSKLKNKKGKYIVTDDDITLLDSVIGSLGKIAEVAKEIPNSTELYDGWGTDLATFFAGNNDLSYFLQQIAGDENGNGGFAKVMSDAAKNLKGFDPKEDSKRIKKAAEAMLAIANVSGEIPNSGGVVSWFVGNNDLGPFLDSVAKFGPSMMACVNAFRGTIGSDGAIGGITKDDITNVKTACEGALSIANLKGKVPKQGLIDKFLGLFGADNFSLFLKKLPDVGKYLAQACVTFKGVNSSDVTDMSRSMTALGSLMSSVTFKDKDGNQSVVNMKDFANKLSKSVKSFKKFITGMSGVDTSKVISVSNDIYDTCKTLAMASSFSDSISKLGPSLDTLSSSMASLSGIASGWNTKGLFAKSSHAEDIKSFIKSISAISKASKKMDTDAVAYTSNVIAYFVKMSKAITTNLKGAANKVVSYNETFKKNGEQLINSLCSGMIAKKKNVKSKISELISTITKYLNKDGVNNLKTSGKNLIEGLINGIKDPDEIQKLIDASKEVGRKVNNAIKKETDEHSPSKKWKKVGVYCLMGLRNGLKDSKEINNLKKSSKSVGSVIDNAVRNRLGIHSPSIAGFKIGSFFNKGIFKGLTSGSAWAALKKGGQMVASVLSGSVLNGVNPQKTVASIMKKFDIKAPNLSKYLTQGLSKIGKVDFSKIGESAYKQLGSIGTDAITKDLKKQTGVSGLSTGIGSGSGSSKKGSGSGSSKKGSGHSGKKHSSSLGKALAKSSGLSEDEISNILDAYKKVFYKLTPKLDKFNKKYVNKHGKISANYIAHSFESALSRRVSMYFSKDLAETINKEFTKLAKNNKWKVGTKKYFNELKKFTHTYMVETQTEMNRLYSIVKKIGGDSALKQLKNDPEIISSYVKAFIPAAEKFSSIVSTGTKIFNTSKKIMGSGIQSFGDYLWNNSDEGKTNNTNLKESLKKEASLRNKMAVEKKKIDNTDSKEHKKKVKQAKASMDNAKKSMALAKKQDKYEGKSYKQWEEIYKKRKKTYGDLINLRTNSAKKLSKLESQLSEQQKKTTEYIKNEAKGANNALNEYNKTIKSTIQEYVKLSASDFANPLTPFSQFQYSDSEENFKSGNSAKKSAAYTFTQVQSYKNWENDMEWIESGASGLSDKIKDYFVDAGYAGADELHKLRFATKDTIEEMNKYFEEMSEVEERNYIRNAKKKFDNVAKFQENLNKLAKQGVLSPEAINDLISQGPDAAANLVDALANDSNKEFAKQYQDSFAKALGSWGKDSSWIEDVTKQIFATAGYAWSDEYKKFVKGISDDTTNIIKAAIDKNKFIDNVANMLSITYGMSNGAVNKIKKQLTNLLSKASDMSQSDFTTYITSKNGPVAKFSKGLKSEKSKKHLKSAIRTMFKQMYGIELDKGVFTLTADDSSKSTAENTADNTEKTSDNTKDTADNTKTTADNTKTVSTATVKTADNTEDIVSNTAKTTDNTAVIADNTTTIANSLGNSSKSAISGTYVTNAIIKYFKKNGMGKGGLSHISSALSGINGQTYDTLEDAINAIKSLKLDKEFTDKTNKQFSSALDYLYTIKDILITSTTINDNPKANTTTNYTASGETTTGATTALTETSKAVSNVSITDDNISQLKDTILTGLLDPDKLQAALHPVINADDLYNRVYKINQTVTNQMKLANQKLDTLHTDNAHMHHTMNLMRDDIRDLQTGLGGLNASISNMKLTMDTGALVGAITPGVDKALGKAASSRRR